MAVDARRPPTFRQRLVLLGCGLLWCVATGTGWADSTAPSDKPPLRLFHTVEFRGSLKALSNWTRIIDSSRHQAERLTTCTSEANCPAAAPSWQQLLRRAAPLGTRRQLIEVNRFFNRWPYRLDRDVYGVADYWATPDEFLKASGDCEDYSITKYFALRQLGYSPEQLRIVVLLDTIRNIAHAVLAVYTEEDIYILDNLSDAVFSHTKYTHYWPQYSVNESHRWAHARIKQALPVHNPPVKR